MGAFVISPLPPVLLELLQTAGLLRSTEITPLRGYYEPLRNPLVFHRLPGCPVIRLPCSADFPTGRGGFLQLLSVSLPSCCRSHPARVARRYSQFAMIHAAFALQLRARPPGKHFRGHLCVHFRYGPMARHHPKDDAVNRFQKFGFPPPCYPSYEASDSYLGGFVLPLNTPAFAGHTTGRADFPHPAFRQISPQAHGRGPRCTSRNRSTPNFPNTTASE